MATQLDWYDTYDVGYLVPLPPIGDLERTVPNGCVPNWIFQGKAIGLGDYNDEEVKNIIDGSIVDDTLTEPEGALWIDDLLYVLDHDTDGVYIYSYTTGGTKTTIYSWTPANWNSARGLGRTVDGTKLYFAYTYDADATVRIREVTISSGTGTELATTTTTELSFASSSVGVDNSGNVHVTGAKGGTYHWLKYDGSWSTVESNTNYWYKIGWKGFCLKANNHLFNADQSRDWTIPTDPEILMIRDDDGYPYKLFDGNCFYELANDDSVTEKRDVSSSLVLDTPNCGAPVWFEYLNQPFYIHNTADGSEFYVNYFYPRKVDIC